MGPLSETVKSSEKKRKMGERRDQLPLRSPADPQWQFHFSRGLMLSSCILRGLTNFGSHLFILGKTKLSRHHLAAGVTTDGWHVPSKRTGGLGRAHHTYRSPKPLQSSSHLQVACFGGMVSLIFRGRTPPAIALRRAGQTSLEARILANSPHQEISLILDREGADAGHSPPSFG